MALIVFKLRVVACRNQLVGWWVGWWVGASVGFQHKITKLWSDIIRLELHLEKGS